MKIGGLKYNSLTIKSKMLPLIAKQYLSTYNTHSIHYVRFLAFYIPWTAIFYLFDIVPLDGVSAPKLQVIRAIIFVL